MTMIENPFGRYILVGKSPVPEPDLKKWAEWIESANRHVARTEVGDTAVSTVFLGLDHSFGGPRPLLFETIVFGGRFDGEQECYATWDEAEAGHQAMVEQVRTGMN